MSHLLNRQTGQLEPAEIFAPMEQFDIDCFRDHWKPILDDKIEELKQAGRLTRDEVMAANAEDARWRWSEKFQERARELQWASYSVRARGQTQGLMYINLLRRCQLQSQQNMHMVYVDLLTTAPWNRPRLVPDPLYSQVGVVLITEAILQSREEGFEGRIGLHSTDKNSK